MKFKISLFIFALTAFGPLTQSHAALEAGTAMVEITPDEWPVTLRGQFNPKPTTSAHDPLNARSLALRNGEGRVVITVVDILYLAQDVVDEIKKDAAAATGWKTTEMLIAGTHTHSAPNISDGNDTPPEVAFRKKAKANISLAIQTAIKNLQPAQAGFTNGELKEEVFNRRWYLEDGKMPANPFGGIDTVKMNPSRSTIVSPAGPTDPRIEVINIQKPNGKPLGLLANYALHYVGGTDGSVSADYYGEFSRLISNRIGGRSPGDFLGIMSNGTSGDINNIDFEGKRPPRAQFEQIGLVAAKAADEVWRATKDLEYGKDLAVGIRERRVTLRYRKPDEALVKRAHEILAMNEEERKSLPRLADHYAVRTLAALEKPDTVDVVIQAIRLGDQAIFALPFEVLVEIGIDLKKESPLKHTMIIELANGAFGYLPPPHQHELGGYETWLGTNKVQKDASVILTKHLLEMMGEMARSAP